MDEPASVSHWALLIGINFYHNKNNLSGCVRDVEHIKRYLQTSLPCAKIQTLTASTPSDSNSLCPAEKPGSWPTYGNVTSSLREITAAAKRGDFVYIHYSGHGHTVAGDLALVLFDQDQKSPLFRGQYLAQRLKKMVDNGLFVTLVLDCCFSGGVVRSGDPPDAVAVRCIDYDPAVDSTYPVALHAADSGQVPLSAFRDGRIDTSWIIEPSGYTVLTACGPHEKAMELTSTTGEKHGALSYFLMQALQPISKTEIAHEELYHLLRMMFWVSWPKQNPMCYGNKDLAFFGKSRLGPGITIIPVFKFRGGSSLYLAAGSAHGVCKDDEYDVFPWSNEVSSGNLAPVRARVDAVRGLTADLVGIDAESIVNQVETPSKAKLRTCRDPRRALVGVKGAENQSQWMATAEQRNLPYLFVQDTEGQDCDFRLTCNERNEYEIMYKWGQKISSLPAIPATQEGALDYVLRVLEHLAAFRKVKEIENRDAETQLDGYTVQLSEIAGKSEKVFDKDEVEVGDEAVVRLRVTNTSEKAIYLHIYNLRPSWQIDNLLHDDGGSFCAVLPPAKGNMKQTAREYDIGMSVPQSSINRGDHQCKDILKVFVTSQQTSLACLTLPKIAVSSEDAKDPIRGDYDQLPRATFLHRGEHDIREEKWATRNFTIHTKRSPASVAGATE